LERRLNKNSFAFDCPSDIIQYLLQFSLIIANSVILFQEGDIGCGKLGVTELLVDIVDKLGVLDEISRFHSILIFQIFDFLGSEVHV
jgi:hypothetical protein